MQDLDEELVAFSFESFWWLKRCREGGQAKGSIVGKRDGDHEPGKDGDRIPNSRQDGDQLGISGLSSSAETEIAS